MKNEAFRSAERSGLPLCMRLSDDLCDAAQSFFAGALLSRGIIGAVIYCSWQISALLGGARGALYSALLYLLGCIAALLVCDIGRYCEKSSPARAALGFCVLCACVLCTAARERFIPHRTAYFILSAAECVLMYAALCANVMSLKPFLLSGAALIILRISLPHFYAFLPLGERIFSMISILCAAGQTALGAAFLCECHRPRAACFILGIVAAILLDPAVFP